MAIIYVRSTDGSDADNGSTWALAKGTLAGAAAIDAAGDTIYVSQVHAESSAASQTIALAGTAASPVRVICGDDSAEPPTAASAAGVVTTTGNFGIAISGHGYIYGLTFNSGSGANNVNINLTTGLNGWQLFENCVFKVLGTTGGSIVLGQAGTNCNNTTYWKNCNVEVTVAAGSVSILGGFVWEGGAWLYNGSTTPTTLFTHDDRGLGGVLISGVDFSALGTTFNIFAAAASTPVLAVIRNCKFPASWSGSLGTPDRYGVRHEMYNCDSADTNYRMWIEDYQGSIKSDTSVYNDAGASDGTTPLSWMMKTSANAKWHMGGLKSGEIVKWNETTGSSVTATVEIVHDGASAFKDDEIWLEVMYLGTSGAPLGAWISDTKADVLASGTAQATSTATWTGDSGTGPNGSSTWNTLKLEVAFTPQEKGFIHARVCMAVASKTAYVDPLLTVT